MEYLQIALIAYVAIALYCFAASLVKGCRGSSTLGLAGIVVALFAAFWWPAILWDQYGSAK